MVVYNEFYQLQESTLNKGQSYMLSALEARGWYTDNESFGNASPHLAIASA